MSTRITDQLVEQVAQLSINEMMFLIAEANKRNDASLKKVIANAVAGDIQQHIDNSELEVACPDCGSTHIKKNGKRNGLQRYACRDCGHRFTTLSNTILEKTYYSWDVWVAIVQSLINGMSLEKTQQMLIDDYHCTDIHHTTVWRMRMKVMNAIAHIPSPKLSGVIQFDDTYFRENQKAAHDLSSPFPADFAYERDPRYGRVPSMLGVRGNEFITVSCAIDTTGHAVARVLGCGIIKPEVMYDFITENTESIAFACSDADKTYKEVFKAMNVPHYSKPSTYMDIIAKEGYEQPSKVNPEKRDEQVARNAKILEKLWVAGKTDSINNRGKMTYNEFKSLKDANSLSLGRVNKLHSEMKKMIERNTAGVSSKFLPMYVAWFQYLHNKKIDNGGISIASKKMAESILVDAINARVNITKEELEEIGKAPLALPKASNQYMRLLNEKTEQMKAETGDKWFQFDPEDGINSFDARKIMREMPMSALKALGRQYHIKYYGTMSRTDLISALIGKDGINKSVLVVAIDRQKHEEFKKARSEERKANKHSNRLVHKSTFAPRMFTDRLTGDLNIMFIDTETTGLNKQYDEVLSLGVVSMNGEVLYDGLFKPQHKKHWKEAQAINGISPAKVANKPHITDEKEAIEAVLADADLICGWNLRYDLDMLYAAGIDLPTGDENYIDLMDIFADEWSSRTGEKMSKRTKLVDACKLLKIKHKKAHTAVGDSAVLIPIAEWLMAA